MIRGVEADIFAAPAGYDRALPSRPWGPVGAGSVHAVEAGAGNGLQKHADGGAVSRTRVSAHRASVKNSAPATVTRWSKNYPQAWDFVYLR